MNYLIGIIAMVCGFIALLIDNHGGAFCCFGYVFILWCLLAVSERKRDKNAGETVAYVCDKRSCAEGCQNPDCHHTFDISHAKNFEKIEANKWIEKE